MRLAKSGDDARAAFGEEDAERKPDFPPKSGGKFSSDTRTTGAGGGGGMISADANGSTSAAGFQFSSARHQTWQLLPISANSP